MRLFAVIAVLSFLLGPLAGPAGFSAAQDASVQTAPDQTALSSAGQSLPRPGQRSDPPDEESVALRLSRWDAEAAQIEDVIGRGEFDSGAVDAMRSALDAQRSSIARLADAANSGLVPLIRQRDALGEASDGEPTEVTAQRAQLDARIATADAEVKRLAQADARAAALLERLSDLRRQLFTRALLTRGPSIFERGVFGRAVDTFGTRMGLIVDEMKERIGQRSDDLAFLLRGALTVALIAVALFFIVGIRRAALTKLMRPVESGTSLGRRVLIGIGVTLVRLLIPVVTLELLLFAVWQSGLVGPEGSSLLYGLTLTVIVVTGAYALGGAYYAPHTPALRLSSLGDAEAAAAHHWLMALAAVVGLDHVLVAHGERSGHAIELLQVMNTGLLAAGGVAVWGYSRYIADREETAPAAAPTAAPVAAPSQPDDEEAANRASLHSDFAVTPMLRLCAKILAQTIAVAAPLLAAIGYYAASRFAFYPVVMSGAAIGIGVLLFYAVHEAVEGFVAPEGSEADRMPSRMQLIPVIVGFLLVCAAVPVLALIWGADAADIGSAWRFFAQGFRIGETTISPLSFFSFLVVFSIGYLLTGLVQRILARSVLPVTGLDAGGRAAVNAGVFYLGVVLSALIAISTTGLDLSNVAIVAGALSVGIGFGLQNIVNNFISGIILLIERPIKAGDWVELSSGTGYVKQVNVRSTEIETFDRAALIVPNSELISGPVTNWTHDNLNGRLIVPVGVAYGTDPRKVEKILIEIAKAHRMLLRYPAPFVLFRRFGADALEFEIRGVLRDINWILSVTSDINFEIARRFAEAGIEIPFAQRDLHLRNAGELGRSIGEAVRGGGDGKPAADPTGDAPPGRARRQRGSGPSGHDAAGDD